MGSNLKLDNLPVLGGLLHMWPFVDTGKMVPFQPSLTPTLLTIHLFDMIYGLYKIVLLLCHSCILSSQERTL